MKGDEKVYEDMGLKGTECHGLEWDGAEQADGKG